MHARYNSLSGYFFLIFLQPSILRHVYHDAPYQGCSLTISIAFQKKKIQASSPQNSCSQIILYYCFLWTELLSVEMYFLALCKFYRLSVICMWFYLEPLILGLAKLQPLGKSGPLPVSITEVLLEYSHSCLFMYYLALLLCDNGRVD